MQIILNLKKKLEKTANEYFEKAKQARKKVEGASKTVLKFEKQLEVLEKKEIVEIEKIKPKKPARTKQWYEKFRWFVSSEGFLCIGGRDATSNEIVIKKHTDPNDLVFHTEGAGSPFFVIKTEGKKPSDVTMQEVADATASFSRAWKLGVSATEVYSITPDQVSKQAPSGEYMPKGGFMIRGKRTYYQGRLEVAIGMLSDGSVMAGPEAAVKANCEEYVIVQQGRGKPSDCAKKVAKKIKADLDDVLRSLPAGTCEIKK